MKLIKSIAIKNRPETTLVSFSIILSRSHKNNYFDEFIEIMIDIIIKSNMIILLILKEIY